MQNGDKPLPSITLAGRGLFVKMLINLEPHHIYKRPLKTHHRIFALFLQTLYAIEKLLGGFNVRDAVDDVTWVHTTSNIFLHS